jgi:hypothetical protein
LQFKSFWAFRNNLASIFLQNGTFRALGWNALSILENVVRKTTESLETSLILQSVASRALHSLALSFLELEHLRTAKSCANTILHGEALFAVLVAYTRDELVTTWAAYSDALSIHELVVLIALSADTTSSLFDRSSRAILDRANTVNKLKAFWTAESEALAVLLDGSGRTLLDKMSDAHVTLLLVAWLTVLHDASSVLELKTFSAGNTLADVGLVIVGEELLITTADGVAFAVDQLESVLASDSDANILA